ncbi:hypothetical protein ABL78_5974 [Leptomonas seymouri]|uniref:Uncharacterized protein n=1 Tax=Leptomonas seymouri TaxID=5684 RepID=A0A0N0P472_LEPSE|nr:hypothetical protein ABL78_5974 [Leptomonas seymouri]|eukprot:KPI84959.1 hypothetical protein ABL78_5974 [Leptomonas seymouri]
MLRSRCPQDNARASRHDPVSVAVPILDTGVLQEAHAQTFLSSPISAAVRWCRGAFTALQRPRRASLLYWYRWLKKRHLLCYAAVTFFFLLLITLLFISFAAIALTWDRPWTQILVQEYLSFQADSFHVRVPGAVQPREPARLWGLTVAPAQPLASPLPEHADRAAQEDYASRVKARLERQYGASLFLYTFVNGTEPNHVYRRLSLGYCGNHIQSVEMQLALNGAVLDGKGTAELCTTPMQRAKTNAEVLAMVDGRAMATTTGRDRETDELRHSIRSVEQHVPWHRGRVVIVSPGHHPTWVDGAKNFLAGACGDASVQALRTRGTHLRLTTVHQDAVMPYAHQADDQHTFD